MCDKPRLSMRYNYDHLDHVMSHTYNSYLEFKFEKKEQQLSNLISSKYLIVLGDFIESMYEGLKFDIFVRYRNPRVKNPQWYGHTYMELRIYDVITSPVYNPHTFDPSYKTPHYNGNLYYEEIYNNIESFLPEINKHLLISFRPLISPHTPIHNIDMSHPKPFECWGEYFSREYAKDAIKSMVNQYF